ncbi:MAG: beta-lactamase family protein [Ignavibacteria bacterium]|jgi:CubicO group peptidase (beta-lactamase class C family)|nr:beta-lactamase family protein [Ignavibacteria bacterium]MCU7512323.1 beta-lactamase family protein [Ignavibacteria bacterium]
MRNALIFFLFLIYTNGYPQQGTILPLSKPGETGFSSDSIGIVNTLMQKYVDEKKLPGIITMIARHGKVVSFEKFGMMDVGKPMQLNAFFRIASMTKPVTSAALMILFDEGRFKLDDPVSKYIPEFKDLKVFSGIDRDGIKLEEQAKPMTIRNLLMHTSGLASGGESNPVDSIYRASNLSGGTLKDMIQKLSKIPLLYQPGTRWNYSRSSDVIAYLVEVISGKPFDQFLRERIFVPLQMEETGYYVPVEKLNRVAAVFCPADSGGIKALTDPEVNNVTAKVKFFSGNGGLISTAKDYMIFSQMLLNKGIYNGIRILKSKTVELMTSDQISDEIMPDDSFFGPMLSGMGFGFGFAVVKSNNQPVFTGSAGSYWWSGSANTYFYIDPEKDLILIFMTQFVPNFHYPVFKEFRELVYKSIIE